jgi:hypothetical protein
VVPTVRQRGVEASEQTGEDEGMDTTSRVVATTPPNIEAPKPGDVAVTRPFTPKIEEPPPGPLSLATGGGRTGRKKKEKAGRGGLIIGLIISMAVVGVLITALIGQINSNAVPENAPTELTSEAPSQIDRLSDSVEIGPFPGVEDGKNDPVASLVARFNALPAKVPSDLATTEHLSVLREVRDELTSHCAAGRWDACAAQSRLSLAIHRACAGDRCESGAEKGAIDDAMSSLGSAFNQLKSIENAEVVKEAKKRLFLQILRLAGTDWALLQKARPKLAKQAQRICGLANYKNQPDCSLAATAAP